MSIEVDIFEELFASVRFEATGKGRLGGVLTKVDESRGTPIVRTTTRYGAPAQRFRPVHERLARQIEERASLPGGFNNALIERYDNAYTTMGAHSDQALDLEEESFIAIFSCYRHPVIRRPPRKLVFESKEPGGEGFEVPLAPGGLVVLSMAENRRLRHKIVLDPSARTPENPWLGITFRTSKTFVRFRDDGAYLVDDTRLTIADDAQRREFYGLRRRENQELGFSYPRITYTISESDLMEPAPL
ncbi:MAG: hypothetical protein U0359_41010 [Byssovorax sp.]